MEANSNINFLLRNLIMPGNHIRLSPYVQQAQHQIIFGSSEAATTPQNYVDQPADYIKSLAKRWKKHAEENGESSNLYNTNDKTLFHAALIEHASRSIPRVQLTLLDLVRKDVFQGDLHIVAHGEFAGVYAVAVMDFMQLYEHTCYLYSLQCPVLSLRITCVAIPRFYEHKSCL